MSADVPGRARISLHDTHVARLLEVSVRTVGQRVERMMRRVGVPSRGALIARCYAAEVLAVRVWPPIWSGTYCLEFTSAATGAAGAVAPKVS
jgi:hypothetical protein